MVGSLRISVVTACYNSEVTIAHAISSLKSQTWSMIEHVVIDGASSDNTQEIARSTLGDGDVFLSEPDHGIYDALNKGIGRSTGDVVGFLHSDDFFADNDVLARVAACFEQGFDAVYGNLQYVDAGNPSRVIRNWVPGDFERGKLKLGWMPPHPTFFMRRQLYEQLGFFDTQFRIASDYDSLLRYLDNSMVKVGYIPEVMVKMRIGGASNGSLKQIMRKSREDIAVMRKNGINPFWALPYKNFSKITQFLKSGI